MHSTARMPLTQSVLSGACEKIYFVMKRNKKFFVRQRRNNFAHTFYRRYLGVLAQRSVSRPSALRSR